MRNLVVPVCISATHVAYGSIRMEPQYMAMGQACGLAAVQAIRNKCAVQDIDVRRCNRSCRPGSKCSSILVKWLMV